MPIRSLKYSHVAPQYPVHHKRKVPFRPVVEPPADFAERAMLVRRFDSDLDRFMLSGADYLEIVVDAFSTNIHKSTQVEGNPLTLAEVRRITRESFRTGPARSVDRPTQEIINHLGRWVMPGLTKLPWSLDTIRTTHAILMDGVADDAIIGTFRKTRSEVRGTDGVAYFLPCPPEYIEEELQALIDWVNRESTGLHPIIGATVFFHEFESIHPFEDGNGRTGRTLFHAYLQNLGLPNAYLCKVEAELLKDPNLYYELLAWADLKGSYTELIDYVTDAMLTSFTAAQRRLSEKDLNQTLDETSKRLLAKARQKAEWFSVREAREWAEGIGDQTIRKHLHDLEERGALTSKGRTRGLRYKILDPMQTIRNAASKQPFTKSDGASAAAA